MILTREMAKLDMVASGISLKGNKVCEETKNRQEERMKQEKPLYDRLSK
jgi:hypothetical protein